MSSARHHVSGAAMAGFLGTVVAACVSDPEIVEDWDGAGISPECEPGVVRITGEMDGQPVDVTSSENFGFMAFPTQWTALFDEGVRVSLHADDPGPIDLGWGQGVFALGDAEPLHCATRGTKLFKEPSRAQLRTLTRLGSCPGTEAVAGTIQGGAQLGGIVSGPSLPEGGAEVVGVVFSEDALGVFFLLELIDGKVLDFDSVRAGGTVYYDGEVLCVEEVTVDTIDLGSYDFTLSGLTRLGNCEEADAVSGYVNLCVDPP